MSVSHDEVLETLLETINQLSTEASALRHGSAPNPEKSQRIQRKAIAFQKAYKALGGETQQQMITDETRITGAEWREFYLHNWPGKDWYIDDCAIEFEDQRGQYILPDDGYYRLCDFGYICWQGPDGKPHKSCEMFPIAPFYERYLKGASQHDTVSFRVPKTNRGQLVTLAAKLGASPIG